MSKSSSETPRIYVASLSDYNAGNLHGVWIDANQSAEQIHAEVAEMLRESKHPNMEVDCPNCDGSGALQPDETCPECDGAGKVPSAEEWAIHDYEGFGGLKIGEYESFEDVAGLAAALAEHGAAFAAWHNYSPSYNTDADDFQEQYAGEWDSLEDYVADYWEQCGEFDAKKISGDNWWHPANYVDWERMGKDLEHSGDIWTSAAEGGKIYVFRNV